MKENRKIASLKATADIDINTDENLSGTTHLNEPVTEDHELEKLKGNWQKSKINTFESCRI